MKMCKLNYQLVVTCFERAKLELPSSKRKKCLKVPLVASVLYDLKTRTPPTQIQPRSSCHSTKQFKFRLAKYSDHYYHLLLIIVSITVINVSSSLFDCASVSGPTLDSISDSSSSNHFQSSPSASERNVLNEEKKKTASIPEYDVKDSNNNLKETNALTYLQRFGYMSETFSTTANLVTELSFQNAIKAFQKFAGLNESGLLDNKTEYYMKIPRCGNKDIPTTTTTTSMHQLATSTNGKLVIPMQFFHHHHQHHHHQLNRHQIGQNRSRRNYGSIRRRRRKRYALQGSKWRRQELTYRISQYPSRYLTRRDEVDQQIAMAFGVWSQVAPIDFIVKRDGRVHIDIRFASGDHGDGDAFDGPGNTLAHAYFPQYGGDAHFDDQEYWTIDSYAGTNIFQVAAHELGHSLGLGHSSVREALMAPFYQKYKPNFKIHQDDIMAIQALYGVKSPPSEPTSIFYHSITAQPAATSTTPSTTTTTTTTTTTVRPPIKRNHHETNDRDDEPRGGDDSVNNHNSDEDADPNSFRPHLSLCDDSRIDTITRTEDGQSYVFKGEYYWLLTPDGVAKGYPRRITTDWDGLPSYINAALTWADGKTFFFKGNKYWRFKNKKRDNGYPKLISTGFAGIPNDIDAAFVWSGNGRTYIFKGTQYWRFDSKSEPPVGDEYPRSIKVWSGVPSYIDAAFKWDNNITYFFKGNQYYRFNDQEFKVEPRGRPQFPRSTAEWWFGCTGSNLAQKRLPLSGTGSLDGRLSSLEDDEFRREPLSPPTSQYDHINDNDDMNLDVNVRNEMIETDDTNSLWSLHSLDSSDAGPKIHGTHINDGTNNNNNSTIVSSSSSTSTSTTTTTSGVSVPTVKNTNRHYYFQTSSSSSSATTTTTTIVSISSNIITVIYYYSTIFIFYFCIYQGKLV